MNSTILLYSIHIYVYNQLDIINITYLIEKIYFISLTKTINFPKKDKCEGNPHSRSQHIDIHLNAQIYVF